MGQPPSAYLNAKAPPGKDTKRSLIRCWFNQGDWTANALHPRLQNQQLPYTHTQTETLLKLQLTMAVKKGPKNSEKSAASSQDDAPKKSQRSSNNGVSGSAPQGSPRSGGCLGFLVTTVFYVALIGAAGFAAFYVQQVVEEIRRTNAKHVESARQSAELSGKMESVVQQVGGEDYESMEKVPKSTFNCFRHFPQLEKKNIVLYCIHVHFYKRE